VSREPDSERFLICVGGSNHGRVVGPVSTSTYFVRTPKMVQFPTDTRYPLDTAAIDYDTETYCVAEFRDRVGRDPVRMLIADGMSESEALARLLEDARWRREAADAKDKLMRAGGAVG
jgi:hypothetical protein